MVASKVFAVVTAAMLVAAVPTAEAQRRGGGGGGGMGRGMAVRSGPMGRPVGVVRPNVGMGGGRVFVGGMGPRRVFVGGGMGPGSVFVGRTAVPRSVVGGRVIVAPRGFNSSRVFVGGGFHSGPRVFTTRTFGPRVVGVAPFTRVAPARFFRPYYTFHRRFNVGFGLWSGFPITYPYYYGYYDPFYYGYPVAPVYPSTVYPSYSAPVYPEPTYPSSGTVQQGESQANVGGLSFEITPTAAQVFVDGQYVGTAGQFTPTSQPLGLTPGRHHILISAPGYQTMEFDTDIVAGEVIPYQGTLER